MEKTEEKKTLPSLTFHTSLCALRHSFYKYSKREQNVNDWNQNFKKTFLLLMCSNSTNANKVNEKRSHPNVKVPQIVVSQ